jgi:3'(2'), 5'-bisphosphate nucleotidase
LLIEEAGGIITDVEGNPLDFSKGRTLASNKGVIATAGKINSLVLDAVKKVLAQQ